jgi:hypothetical protein
MVNRNYILDRLTSKTTTQAEFNFDNLQAPPINSIFSIQDLQYLHYLATSLKLSGKPLFKFNEIDKIMESRGFSQFINGTNRVVYKHNNFNFLCKVAYNSESCKDSLKEFHNQYFLKPFVTKIFEVTPDGVVAFCEKVEPITSTEEYRSIAKDIYVMFNEWFLGSGFIFDDMGSEDFMNTGIRKNFGPVILDFPYVYHLDPNKIFCVSPDNNSPTGCCEGEIDYDAGFNQLSCSKCGAKYRAKELAQKIKDNKNIIKNQGGIAMKFTISGGKLGDEVIEYNGVSSGVKSIPRENNKKNNHSFIGDEVVEYNGLGSLEVNPVENVIKDERPKKEVHQAIEIDESLIKKPYKEEFDIEEFNKFITDYFIHFDSSIDPIWNEKFIDSLIKIVDTITFDFRVDDVNIPSIPKLLYLLEKVTNLYSTLYSFAEGKVEEYSEETDRVDKINLPNLNVNEFTINWQRNILNDILSSENFILKNKINSESVTPSIYYSMNPENGITHFDLALFEPIYGEEIEIKDLIEDNIDSNLEPDVNIKDIIDENLILENNKLVTRNYNDIKEFAAEIINVKDVFPEKNPKKIMVIIDSDGDYITVGDEGDLLAIDNIDSRELNKLSIVAKSWYDSVMDNMEQETKEIPVGVEQHVNENIITPKSFGVNGIDETEEE